MPNGLISSNWFEAVIGTFGGTMADALIVTSVGLVDGRMQDALGVIAGRATGVVVDVFK